MVLKKMKKKYGWMVLTQHHLQNLNYLLVVMTANYLLTLMVIGLLNYHTMQLF